jgi:ribosomal protein S18 acetylase RimI-like enzyme
MRAESEFSAYVEGAERRLASTPGALPEAVAAAYRTVAARFRSDLGEGRDELVSRAGALMLAEALLRQPPRSPMARGTRALVIRAVEATDDLVVLTNLVHAAYAPHASNGLRFWGTHQSVEDTAKRLASGQGFLALADGEVVGTITVRPSQPNSPVPLFRMPDVWSLCQFAVHPDAKGVGVGRALHEHALRHAAAHGAQRMALDTAAPATSLIGLYRSWGYEECGSCDWRPHTNYLSTLMARRIEA